MRKKQALFDPGTTTHTLELRKIRKILKLTTYDVEWRASTTPYSFSGIISQFHENIYLLTHLLVIRRLISFLEDGRYNKATIKKATRASIPGNTENAPLRYRAQGSPQGLENKIKWSMGSVTVECSWRVTGLQSRTMLKWTSHGISVYFDNKLLTSNWKTNSLELGKIPTT